MDEPRAWRLGDPDGKNGDTSHRQSRSLLAIIAVGSAWLKPEGVGCAWLLETFPEQTTPFPMVKVAPIYPTHLRRPPKEARVVVEYEVDVCGRVSDPRIVASTHRAFEGPTLIAAKQFLYVPASYAGAGVATTVRTGVSYTIVIDRR